MKKRVNINPTRPIQTIGVPIFSQVLNVEMSVGDILNCICAGALVDEILPSGELLRLDFSNYDKKNFKLENKSKVVEEVKPEVKEAKTEEVKPEVKEAKTEEVKPEIKEETKVEEKVEEAKQQFKNDKKKK